MSSPARYPPFPSRCFSPRVLRRLEARLEKIAKERNGIGERDNDPSVKAREGPNIKKSGHAGEVGDYRDHDHISDHSSGYRGEDNDFLLVQTSSDEASVHETRPDDSLLDSPVLLQPKEDPNGMPSTTALCGLSLVEG